MVGSKMAPGDKTDEYDRLFDQYKQMELGFLKQLGDQRVSEPAKRYDKGKSRYDLLPPDALEALVEVYTIGAEKYSERNWEQGMSWSRCFASLMRHAWVWWRGENSDIESKKLHMAHVVWNAMALLTYQLRNVGIDDRPKG